MTSGAGCGPRRAAHLRMPPCGDEMETRMRVLLALLLSCLASAAHAGQPRPAEVAVLATLHKLHAEVPAYSNAVLHDSILRLAPDVLCIEVRPDRYAQRAPEA